jgi:hypothetical protein
MIIRYYQRAYSVQFFIYTLVAVLLWIDAFFFPAPAYVFHNDTLIYEGLVTVLHRWPDLVQVILAFILLLTEAVLINAMLIRHKFVNRLTFLPGMLYIVLMSCYPSLLTITPGMIANLFIIFSLNVTLGIYLKPEPYKEIFNATFLISLASAFYLPALIYLILFWFALLIYRISSLREWIITLSGLAAPYLFIAFYYFWFDHMQSFTEHYLLSMATIQPFQLELSLPLQKELLLGLAAVIFILILISFIKMSYETGEKVIAMRKKMNVVLYSLIVAGASFFYGLADPVVHSAILMVPVTTLTAYYFTGIKRFQLAETLFTVILVLILLNKLILRFPDQLQ